MAHWICAWLPATNPATWAAPIADYNPQKAADILEKAGFTPGPDGMRIHVRLSTTSSPSILLMVQAIQQQLRAAGIDLQINTSEWGTFYGQVKKGNFQMFLLSWVGVFDADIYDLLFHSRMIPPDGANRGRYRDEHMDALLNALMQSASSAQRLALAHAVQQKAADDMIYLPLWKRHNLVLMRPEVNGYQPDVEGGYLGLLATSINE